jgi:LPXTG-motif cell wall-anchored protein
VKRSRLIAGILLLVAAALVFVGLDSSSSVPIAGGLAVVGIALVAISRRRSR